MGARAQPAPRRRFWYRAQREWLVLVVLLAALALWNGPLGNQLSSQLSNQVADRLDRGPGPGPRPGRPDLPSLTSLPGEELPQPDPTGQVESQGAIVRLDLALYDFFLRSSAPADDPGIVIIAIDDKSIAQIGHWPWRRPIIAELVAQVAAMQPRALGIDIVFAEPAADPRDDEILAAAFERARPILAVGRQPFGATRYLPLYPIPELAGHARLGHIVQTHGADGRVRGLFAREGHLPAMALTLVDPDARGDRAAADAMLARGEWSTRQALMPRARPKVESYPAVEVLTGNVPAEKLRDRRVLIGAIAVGIGDIFSTPLVIGSNRASGVELHAVAAAALDENRLIHPIHPWSHALLTLAAIIGLMVVLFRAAPQYSLPICVAAIAVLLLITALAFHHDRWLQPAGLLTAFALAYPLWSWRRLSAAAAGLLRHARRLEAVPSVLTPTVHAPRSAEPIARDLARLSDAATQVRLLNRFLLDGLESLPHPVLIAEPTGRILFRNQRMSDAFGDRAPGIGADATAWFEMTFHAPLPVPRAPGASELTPSRGIEFLDERQRNWLASLNLTSRADDDPRTGAAAPTDAAATDGQDPVREPLPDSGQRLMLQLVDITALRAAEREREEAISFLSHDLRSPQVSILAMASAQGEAGDTSVIDPAALRRHAHRALELTDEFLAFARAGSKPIEREPHDLADLATEVVDLSWERAHKRGIRLCQAGLDDVGGPAVVICDAGMIRRAVLNLLENAIRHSAPASTVTVRIGDGGSDWTLAVEDEGPGIDPTLLATIFQAWSQADRPAHPAHPASETRGSSGLGLAMVQRTLSRHGGSVNARNRTQSPGAVFEIRLPKAPAGIIFGHGTADDRTEPRNSPLGGS